MLTMRSGVGVNVHGFLHIQYPVVDQPCNVLVCTCISAKKLIESVKVVKYSSKMIHTSCQIKCMTLWSTITEDQEVTVGKHGYYALEFVHWNIEI